MADEPFVKETRVVLEEDEIKHATGFRASLVHAEEITDDEVPKCDYWQAFFEAENMLEGVYEEDSDSESENVAASTDEEE
jgi:hypothetical protein